MKSEIALAFLGGVIAHFVGGRVVNGILYQITKREAERAMDEQLKAANGGR